MFRVWELEVRVQDMAAHKDWVQDITACVCSGEREGWNKVKKTNVCRFSPEWFMSAGQLSLPAHVCVSFLVRPWRLKHWFDEKTKWKLCVCVCFSVKVMQFNRERAAPDVSQEEHSHNFSISSLPTETGFRWTQFTLSHTQKTWATLLQSSGNFTCCSLGWISLRAAFLYGN